MSPQEMAEALHERIRRHEEARFTRMHVGPESAVLCFESVDGRPCKLPVHIRDGHIELTWQQAVAKAGSYLRVSRAGG